MNRPFFVMSMACGKGEKGVPHSLKGKRRILVVGSSGAGKSTLARQLGQALGLPVVHLDQLYWTPGWEARSHGEFDALLAEALAGDAWIIDGNYQRTLETRLARADCVVWLRFPRVVCEWGVLKRVLSTRGKTRPDMAPGCPERLDWEFLRWVWDFPKQDGARVKEILARHPEVPVITLENGRRRNRLLREVRENSGRV